MWHDYIHPNRQHANDFLRPTIGLPGEGHHTCGEMVITLHIEPSAEQQMRALGSQYRVRLVMS
jgi:hypothetical protein